MITTQSMPDTMLYKREEIELLSSDPGPSNGRRAEGASAGKLEIPYLIIS